MTHLPFLFADPQLMESAQACENASSQPSPMLAFDWIPRSVNFDLPDDVSARSLHASI